MKADSFCLIALASRGQRGCIGAKSTEQMITQQLQYSFEAGIITAELS